MTIVTSRCLFFLLLLSVQDANFFSSEVSAPHRVTVLQGQPTAIDCGPYTSIPASDLDWEVQFGDHFEEVSVANDRATAGLNQSLWLLQPTLDDDGTVFRCGLEVLGMVEYGYVEINVQGIIFIINNNINDAIALHTIIQPRPCLSLTYSQWYLQQMLSPA